MPLTPRSAGRLFTFWSVTVRIQLRFLMCCCNGHQKVFWKLLKPPICWFACGCILALYHPTYKL
nr:MAG TPA: hypothetical protein [Caudoviricetes sp.]